MTTSPRPSRAVDYYQRNTGGPGKPLTTLTLGSDHSTTILRTLNIKDNLRSGLPRKSGRDIREAESWSDTPITSLEVRERLVDALKLDLVGPSAGHALSDERLPAGCDRQIGISPAFDSVWHVPEKGGDAG